MTRTEAIEKLTDIYLRTGMYDIPRAADTARRHAELAVEHLPVQLDPEPIPMQAHLTGAAKLGA